MTKDEEIADSFVWPVQLTDDWEESADLILLDLESRLSDANTCQILDVAFFESGRAMNRMHEQFGPNDWTAHETLLFMAYLSKKLVAMDKRNRALRIAVKYA